MSSTCCGRLLFLCRQYQRVRVKGKAVKHRESTQMLLHWEIMVMLHLQAGSPVLARNAHSTASGHMLPRAQVRPLLGGGVGFRGTGFRPK